MRSDRSFGVKRNTGSGITDYQCPLNLRKKALTSYSTTSIPRIELKTHLARQRGAWSMKGEEASQYNPTFNSSIIKM